MAIKTTKQFKAKVDGAFETMKARRGEGGVTGLALSDATA